MIRKHKNGTGFHTSASIISPRIDMIKMKTQEIACVSADWMKQAQDRFQLQYSLTIVIKLHVP
jgi:hypothetical protein